MFGEASLLDGHNAIQQQVSSPNLTWRRNVCLAAARDGRLEFELMADNIAELCEHSDFEYPNRRKYFDDDAAGKYVGVIMAKLFEDTASLQVDNYQISKAEGGKYNEKSKRHLRVKTYKITISGK